MVCHAKTTTESRMSTKTVMKLEKAIKDYLQQWITSPVTKMQYEPVLKDFLAFVRDKEICWDEIFASETVNAFKKDKELSHISTPIRELSWYLFLHKRIAQPIRKSYHQVDLPPIYDQYLMYHEKWGQVSCKQIKHIRRVLCSFHDYLERSNSNLSTIRIDQVDAFLAEFHARFSPNTASLDFHGSPPT